MGGWLEAGVIREGFLEEVFDLALRKRRREMGLVSCADACSQLLLAQCSGPQAAFTCRGVNKAECAATSPSSN